MRELVGDHARRRLLGVFAGFTVLWFGACYGIPVQLPARALSDVSSILYDGWAIGVAALAVVWAVMHRAARSWLPLVAALLAMAVGDGLWDISAHGLIPVPNDTPSIMDLFYLPAYIAFGINVVLLVRRYHGPGIGALLETVIVAGGAAAAAFPLLIDPYAAGVQSGTVLSRGLHLLYPVCDVLLFAAMVVVGFASPHVRALRLVGTAAVLCMVADYLYARQEAAGTYSGHGWLDWLWLLQYTLMAAAVMSRMPAPARDEWDAGVVRRMLLLVTAAMICPALLVGVRFGLPLQDREQAEGLLSLASLVLICLVSVRLVGLLRENTRTVADLRAALAEREQLSQDLDHQANHDPVTGLPNRRRLTSVATATVRITPGSHAIIFVDLDDFTAVNDTFGPSAGDVLLRTVAARLSAASGPHELVARIGGDEFAILLPGRTADGAQRRARQLLDLIAAPVGIEGRTLTIGASAGVAVFADQSADHAGARPAGQSSGAAPASAADAVLDGLVQADVAMYAAKRAGRNHALLYSDAMREQVLGDASLAADLVLAISSAELEVAYQPIVDLRTGRVAAVEALVRWDHPERGAMSPALFLPIAQLRGIIADVDLLVIDTAVAQLAVWREQQPGLRLAVNASAQLLAREDVVQQLLGFLRANDLPGTALIVEVTEQSVIDDSERAAQCLQELREHGVSIALDDFGTGYSSLSYLQQLPVDLLKLDQSFIDRGITAAGLSPLLRAVIELGHELGVAVVAEGIETQAQLQALERAGCERGQGWLFAKAVPADQVPGYLEVVLPETLPGRTAVTSHPVAASPG